MPKVEKGAEMPTRGLAQALREAGHLFEELQLCGILKELPHGSRAVVGHEGFLTEGDGFFLGNGEGT